MAKKRKYRSKFEKTLSTQLNKVADYEDLKLSYIVEKTYTPDWVDYEKNIIFETKGQFDAADRRKMKIICEQYKEYRIIIVFQNPNVKISKKSPTTYATWCDKNGIEWCNHVSLPSLLKSIYDENGDSNE